MGTTLSTPARNAACDAVVDLLDAGTGSAKLKIRNDADAVLCEIPLPDPVFGDAEAGVATAAAISEVTVGTGGTADNWIAEDKDGELVLSGEIGTSGSGASLILSSLTLVADEKVQIDSWTHTQPASV